MEQTKKPLRCFQLIINEKLVNLLPWTSTFYAVGFKVHHVKSKGVDFWCHYQGNEDRLLSVVRDEPLADVIPFRKDKIKAPR